MKKKIIKITVVFLLIGLSSSGCDYCFKAVNRRDYDLAIKECTEQVNAPHIFTSMRARSYINRGVAYAGKGLPDKAIADYNKAIEIDPTFALAYNNRGAVSLQQSLHERAIEDFTKAISLKSDFTLAYYNRAFAYKQARRFSDAFRDLDTIINLNQDDEIAYSMRASFYAANGELDHALIDHNKAVSLNPKNSVLYDLRGSTHLQYGQYEKAENDFNRAIELNPKNASAYYNMACVYSLEKEIDKACAWLSKSVSLGYNNWAHIRSDADLNNIRGSSCYQTILAEHVNDPANLKGSEASSLTIPERRLFSKGMTGITLLFGRGTGFDNTYSIYGLRAGHFIKDGLEIGFSIEEWTGASPRIVRASPDIRYVFHKMPYVNPYGGFFFRHSFVETYDDVNEIGVRAGVNVLLSKRSYLGAGIVYQSALSCSGKCASVNPEIMAAVLF